MQKIQIMNLAEGRLGEAAFRASEAVLRSLVDSLPDAVVVCDRQERIVFSNARTERVLGYTQEELGRLPFQSLIAPFQETEFLVFRRGVVADPHHQRTELMCRRKDGKEIPVEVLATELELAGEQVNLHIIRDLTERKRLERERDEMEVQLRHALKLESIGQLAAGIAHEINTPTQYLGDNLRFLQQAIGCITGFLPKVQQLLDLAREGPLTSEQIGALEAAAKEGDIGYYVEEVPLALAQSLEGVERVACIVRAMKDFSHPGVTEKALVDVNHSVESTITVARNEWKYVADLHREFEPSLPLVSCVPGEINQVVLNLIVNAAHAIAAKTAGSNGEKGVITVATRKEGDWVLIEVSDTGTGIPLKVRHRVFEPFFTTKEVGKGTGQGLSIARAVVVDKHGGQIEFRTREGEGTSFTVRLPCT